MKPRTYVETSVISYLASRPSRDVVTAAHQQITQQWWKQRTGFELFISELVSIEALRGDHDAATKRMALLDGLPYVELNDQVRDLARRFVESGAIPKGSDADAVHAAAGTIHHMQFLVTWNCRHIANAFVIQRLKHLCDSLGLMLPTICTPEQLIDAERSR